MSKSTKSVTAADVRNYFRADAKRLARLSPAAQATVAEGAKGRLHAEVVTEHNKRRNGVTYTVGATKVAKAASEDASVALRKAAADAGFPVGKRGPVSKQALATLKTLGRI